MCQSSYISRFPGLLASALLLSLFSSQSAAQIIPSAILAAADGAAGDQHGWSVAIDGNTAIVGAPLDDDGAVNSGSVYVYVNDGAGNWSQQQKIGAHFIGPDDTNQPADADTDPDLVIDSQRGAQFGYSVAISGDTAVVGAPFFDIDSDEDDVLDTLDAGAIYIFERVGAVWLPAARFTVEEADVNNGDWFGSSVAIHEDTIVVGALSQSAAGQVYILYRETDGNWKQQFARTINEDLGIEEQKTLLPLVRPVGRHLRQHYRGRQRRQRQPGDRIRFGLRVHQGRQSELEYPGPAVAQRSKSAGQLRYLRRLVPERYRGRRRCRRCGRG